MRWATRSHCHVDRAACAWLIRRFIDPEAEFVFVDDPTEVPGDATAFDMRGVALSHHGASLAVGPRARIGLVGPNGVGKSTVLRLLAGEEAPNGGAVVLDHVRELLNKYGLTPVSLSGHSDLTTKAGLADGLKALVLTEKLGLNLMNTAIGGHYSEDEDEAGFMANIGELADAAAANAAASSPTRSARPVRGIGIEFSSCRNRTGRTIAG